MIRPTVGRVVWFHPHRSDPMWEFLCSEKQPCAGIVAFVTHDHMVSLTVFDHCGVSHPRQNVWLLQDDERPPDDASWCEWMPYQKGHAEKTEELEAKLSTGD